MSFAVGIDLGGTNTKLAVVDRAYRILTHRSVPTQPETGPRAVIAALTQVAEALVQQANLAHGDVVGVGFATPGPLDLGAGRITKAANLPGWHHVPVRDLLRERIGLPVTLENDGNAAAFGEYIAGAGVGCEHLVVLTLGTGVGAGVIVDGAVLHGHFDNAGELGHMIVVVDGLPCPCGQRGCLERYASADAIVRRVEANAETPKRRNTETCRPEPTAYSLQSTAEKPRTASDIARAATNGDAVCAKVWDEACKYLAVACVNIQHAFNPQRILLGGGMSLAGDLLLAPVREHVRSQAWSLHADLPEITLAKLGPDAGVIGAAALAFDAFGSS